MRLLLLLTVAAPLWSADWVRITAPGIEILTDAGERTGREVIERFDGIHRIFLHTSIADSPLTVRVFVFSTEKEFHTFRGGEFIHGFYQSGLDRDYIVMHGGPGAARVASHEYVHVLLNHSSVTLPKWFEEGTADFYSTFETVRGRLILGKPIEEHVAALAREPFFYAESWALVHMLNLSPAWRDGLPRFVTALADGQPSEEAFRKAFGKNLEAAISAMAPYARALRSVSLPAPPSTDSVAMKTEPISGTEATIARAGLAMQMSRRDMARSMLAKLPDSAEAAAALGALALSEDRKGDARRHLERAMALGTRDGAAYYEYAMLERDSGAARATVDQWLEKVLAVNPNFAEAHFLLGVHATDDGNPAAAIGHLREAVRILPRRSYFWHALGYAEWKMGKIEEARESARRAVVTAANADEAKMAETLAGLAEEKDPVPEKRPAVTTPSSWQTRTGDARIEGVLTNVDCQGAAARLKIGALQLEVLHPDQVEMVNAPESSYQFKCGAQEIKVRVEYVAATREVTRIEFR